MSGMGFSSEFERRGVGSTGAGERVQPSGPPGDLIKTKRLRAVIPQPFENVKGVDCAAACEGLHPAGIGPATIGL
jgi:hypothetical protein